MTLVLRPARSGLGGLGRSPGGNRSADQKELEAEEQARVDAIDEMEEEDLRAIYRKSRRHTNPVARCRTARPKLTALYARLYR